LRGKKGERNGSENALEEEEEQQKTVVRVWYTRTMGPPGEEEPKGEREREREKAAN